MILDVKTLDDDVPAYLVNTWHFNLINPYFNKYNYREVYRKHVHSEIFVPRLINKINALI
jgi:hypothetical protein